MKVCNCCREEKSLDCFYRKVKSRRHIGDGHENKCKQCTCAALKTPEKRARANELRRGRPLTDKQKQANRLYSSTYAQTETGKESAKKRRQKYLSKPANRERYLAAMARYRKTKAFKDSVQKYRKQHPERRDASIAINNAVAAGKIIRPGSCTVCGRKCQPEGHHPDYSKPLEVIWVCRECHLDYHWSR